jgi:transcriptional regulator
VYIPVSFNETRLEVLQATIERHPLAALVTMGAEGLTASHIPLLYYPSEGDLGVLRGHLARANPQWQNHLPQYEALAIFSGPEHYVSPTWYPSMKKHGEVVPTWNYVVVHARGTLSFKEEPEWLLANVSTLTDAQEKSIEMPWRVSNAPPEFIEGMLRAIVGVELAVTQLEGKWKVSQNRPAADREGVIVSLQKLDSLQAQEMAELVKEKLPE